MNAPRKATAEAGVEAEYLVVVRKLGSLQRLFSQLVRQHCRQVSDLERRLMRQSTRLLLEVTRCAWGLAQTPAPGAAPRQAQRFAAWQTQAVICRTGCAMDDYHWRDGDHCRLLGGACGHADAAAAAAPGHPPPKDASAPQPSGY